MRKKRPATKMVRVRVLDLKRMKELARQSQKQLPDFQSELIKVYNKTKRK